MLGPDTNTVPLAPRQPEEVFGEGLDRFAMSEAPSPFLRNPLLAVVRPGELAVDGAGRVGVVAQVDGEERPVPEGLA